MQKLKIYKKFQLHFKFEIQVQLVACISGQHENPQTF